MTPFDITPLGAMTNAIGAASDRSRKETRKAKRRNIPFDRSPIKPDATPKKPLVAQRRSKSGMIARLYSALTGMRTI